jgi:hypothetical protein
MIYHIQTFCTYGYWPEDLTLKSNKLIIAACDNCGKIRITKKQAYRDLCVKCAQQKRGKEQIISDKTKEKMSHARLDYLKENPITDETKKKMSDSAVKRCEENPVTDEMKEKNRKTQIERYKNPLEREKTSKAMIKCFEDPLEREKLSIAQLKRFEDPLEHEKLSIAALKRDLPSNETKEKISKANIKRFEDPLEREKLSIAMIKRFKNPLERKKISEANIKQYAEMEDPGQQICLHHYIYDFNDLNKYTIEVTRAEHMSIHQKLRRAKLQVPCINIMVDD